MDAHRYRYFTTDLLTNEILAEIPFQGVSWGRAIRKAGEFSGSIPVTPETAHLNIYNSTMPGKTGLYVVRDDKCVWGGIIWSRDYDAVDRTLSVSGAEFPSYFYHRFVWKTLVDRSSGSPVSLYTSEAPVQIGSYSATGGVATLKTRPIATGTGALFRPHLLSPGDPILIQRTGQEIIDGAQDVYEIVDPYTFTVLVDSSDTIATTDTTLASFTKTMDTYEFVRDILARASVDFAGLDTPRDYFMPTANFTFSIIGKERNNNIARITVDGIHSLIPGQEVVVKDVDNVFDGRHTVTATPSDNSFEYENTGDDVAPADESGLRTATISKFSALGPTITITTDLAGGPNYLSVGDEIVVDAGRPRITSTGAADTLMDIFDETGTVSEVVDDNVFKYTRVGPTNSFWYFQRDIAKAGIDYNAGTGKWTVTLETTEDHGYQPKAKVRVVGLGLPYNTDTGLEIKTTPTTKQLTYEVSRTHQIYLRSSKGGVVTMFTETPHGFLPGETIEISGYNSPSSGGYNGTWTLNRETQGNRIIFTKKRVERKTIVSFIKDVTTISVNTSNLTEDMAVAGTGIASGTVISTVGASSITLSKKTTAQSKRVITTASATSGAVVLTVASTVGILVGMRVTGTGITGTVTVKAVNTTTKKVTISSGVTTTISGASLTFSPVLVFTESYPDTAGDAVVPPAGAAVKAVSDITFAPIKVSRGEIYTQTDTITVNDNSGTVSFGPRSYITTYGGFAKNSDIGIEVSEETNSGVLLPRRMPYLGSSLKSVGEILEEVSAGPDGFEYRIDCDIDPETKKFTRTFVLSGYDYPDEPDEGDIRSIAGLGADKYVFDYPGNIATLSVSESAENAATRFWVTGSDGGGGEGGEEVALPMAGASSDRMLRQGWPVLDATEQIDGEATGSSGLYVQAVSFLSESLPPIDEFSITINGSMDPQVGSFNPGDWCSLVIDDEFIKAKLASDREPRNDILVRKIYGYSVSVPDAYGMPETVELTLIRDEEVEYVGE